MAVSLVGTGKRCSGGEEAGTTKMGLSGFIIGFSIVVISVSASVVLYFGGALDVSGALLSGFAIFVLLTALQLGVAVARVKRSTANQVADLRETLGHTLRQITALTERVDQIHTDLSDRQDQDNAQLNAEVTLVESALRELADTVDGLQTGVMPIRTSEQIQQPEPKASEQNTLTDGKSALRALAGDQAGQLQPLEYGLSQALLDNQEIEGLEDPLPDVPQPLTTERDILIQRLADSALADDRAELCLQPIVTLPQRRVVYYDAITRLKSRDGGVLWPHQYGEALENTGGITALDMVTIPRAQAVAKRLTERGRDVSIFVPISPKSLVDGMVYKTVLETIQSNKLIAQRIVFSIAQPLFDEMGPLEEDMLLAVREAGVRLALHDVNDMRFDGPSLSQRGVRFIRVAAQSILNGAETLQSDIHPADLGGLLARAGLRLVAGNIGDERMVVDLLDYDIQLAQGDLFSPPRPVRSDVLSSISTPQIAVAN